MKLFDHSIIQGVKVIKAREGSVVLDIRVHHAATFHLQEAFDSFKHSIEMLEIGINISTELRLVQGSEKYVIEKVESVSQVQVASIQIILLTVLVPIAAVLLILFGYKRLFAGANGEKEQNSGVQGCDNTAMDEVIA